MTTEYRFTYRHRDGCTGRLAVQAASEAEARERVAALARRLDVKVTGMVDPATYEYE